MKMKIYEIRIQGEKVWVTGRTNIHAFCHYCSVTGEDLYDFEPIDEIIEIPEEKWSEFTITDSGQTFEEWIKENDEYPDIIAVTMY